MKPIILAVLALLICSRPAFAELTVQQQHQARQLADVSVQVLDLGKSTRQMLQKNPRMLQAGKKDTACLLRYADTQGFYRYQLERAEQYVAARPAAHIAQDLAVLDSETVTVLHQLATGGQTDDTLLRKNRVLRHLMLLATDRTYGALAELLNLPQTGDDQAAKLKAGKDMGDRYWSWIQAQCQKQN